MLCYVCSFFCCNPYIDEANWFFGCTAVWASDSRDGNGDIGVAVFEGAFCHCGGALWANSAIVLYDIGGYTQKLLFGLVRVGHDAAIKYGGSPWYIRYCGGDKPACTAFCGGNGQAFCSQDFEEVAHIITLDHLWR